MINEALALQHWLITECENWSWRFHSVKRLAPHGQTTRTSSCCSAFEVGRGHLGEKGVERRQKVAEGGEWQDPEPRAFKVSHPPRPALLMNHPCPCPCPLPPRRAATWVMGSVCNNTGVAIYSTILPLFPCSTSRVPHSLLLLNVGWFEPKQSTVGLSQPLQRVLIFIDFLTEF